MKEGVTLSATRQLPVVSSSIAWLYSERFCRLAPWRCSHFSPCVTLRQGHGSLTRFVYSQSALLCVFVANKVYQRRRWWPLLMSSKPGSRWRLERARRHTAESSTVSGRSSERKVSVHFGKAQEVEHSCIHAYCPTTAFKTGDKCLAANLRNIQSPVSSSLQILTAVWCNSGDLWTLAKIFLRWFWRTVSTPTV